MIEIKNVTKKFGDFTAVEDINFTVGESSIYGLVGYNGAGKTTLLKVCAGIYKPEGGAVFVDDENIFDNDGARGRMFFIADEVKYNPRANLLTLKKFYKRYYPDFSDSVFDNMTDALSLDRKKSLKSFSKGMQRQAQIIMAMATKPKYMLLDEVFDGIDPQKRNFCKNLLLEYISQTGCSIIMSSHNLHEVADICDHVGLINGKKLKMNVSVDDISAAYRKYRMIFSENVEASVFNNIPNKGVKLDGKLATIIVASDFDESRLHALKPIHIDSLTLSLEEVFLNEMEDKDYDIEKIFAE